MAQQSNLFLLAADNSPTLLDRLRANPTLASSQDEHGYSLLHAAASYNHLGLLKQLAEEFHLAVNELRDEDKETCLFVVETIEAAKCLVEDLHVDPNTRNAEGVTAAEKLEEDGDFPEVVVYLKQVVGSGPSLTAANGLPPGSTSDVTIPPPLPPNVTIDVSAMPDPAASDEPDVQQPDPEFRRRIEELAAQENLNTEEGQKELKELVGDAVRGVSRRDVRRRLS